MTANFIITFGHLLLAKVIFWRGVSFIYVQIISNNFWLIISCFYHTCITANSVTDLFPGNNGSWKQLKQYLTASWMFPHGYVRRLCEMTQMWSCSLRQWTSSFQRWRVRRSTWRPCNRRNKLWKNWKMSRGTMSRDWMLYIRHRSVLGNWSSLFIQLFRFINFYIFYTKVSRENLHGCVVGGRQSQRWADRDEPTHSGEGTAGGAQRLGQSGGLDGDRHHCEGSTGSWRPCGLSH